MPANQSFATHALSDMLTTSAATETLRFLTLDADATAAITETSSAAATAAPAMPPEPGGKRDSYPVFLLNVGLSLCVLAGNLATCLAVRRTPALRVRASLYVVHRALADGLVGLACGWWAFNYLPASRPFFDRWQWLCQGGNLFFSTSGSQSLLMLTLVAVDRLLSLELPFFHVRAFSGALTKRAINVAWALSIIYGSLIAFVFNRFDPQQGCGTLQLMSDLVKNYLMPIPTFTVVLLTAVCYARISCIACRHRQRRRSLKRHVSTPQQFNELDNGGKLGRQIRSVSVAEAKTAVDLELGRSQLAPSSASGAKTAVDLGRSRSQPASNSVSDGGPMSTGLFLAVNCLFVACWCPLMLYIVLANNWLPRSAAAHSALSFLAISNSALNVLIYAGTNRHFARAYKDLFRSCFRCRTN